MLIRGLRQLVFFAVPFLLFVFIGAGLYDKQLVKLPSDVWPEDGRWPAEDLKEKNEEQDKKMKEFFSALEEQKAKDKAKFITEFDPSQTHREIYSVSTVDKKWFKINFGDHEGFNANLLPSPFNNNTWIAIAQRKSPVPNTVWFSELWCEAHFVNGELACVKSPLTMTVGGTWGDQCKGKVSHFGFNIGPHDARAFYGPEFPFTMFGSNSKYTCFGIWVQDLRMLMDWKFEQYNPKHFRFATELQRPPPYGQIEKNWFMFWDSAGQMYVHYDITPKRVFASIGWDGKVGKNLAVTAYDNDKRCMAKYMPKLNPDSESIHQATNSLAITLCKRSDPSCKPTDANTYIMTIFQHKTFYSFHSVYEPLVMLFRQSAPFEVHGISTKPLWISGRSKPGEKDQPATENQRPDDHTGMFYVTSMSWKAHGQKYHGYLDDVVFLGFGIEDARTGAIDVLAADLLQDIGLCSDVGSGSGLGSGYYLDESSSSSSSGSGSHESSSSTSSDSSSDTNPAFASSSDSNTDANADAGAGPGAGTNLDANTGAGSGTGTLDGLGPVPGADQVLGLNPDGNSAGAP